MSKLVITINDLDCWEALGSLGQQALLNHVIVNGGDCGIVLLGKTEVARVEETFGDDDG